MIQHLQSITVVELSTLDCSPFISREDLAGKLVNLKMPDGAMNHEHGNYFIMQISYDV